MDSPTALPFAAAENAVDSASISQLTGHTVLERGVAPVLSVYAAVLFITAAWLVRQQRDNTRRASRSTKRSATGSKQPPPSQTTETQVATTANDELDPEELPCQDEFGEAIHESWLSLPRLQLRVLRQDLQKVAGLLVVMLLSSAAWAGAVPLMGHLLAGLAEGAPLEAPLLLLVLLKVARPLLEYLKYRLLIRLQAEREFALREVVFAHIASLDLAYFDKSRNGKITPIANSDVKDVVNTTFHDCLELLESAIGSAIMFVTMLRVSVKLTALVAPVLVFLPVSAMSLLEAYHARGKRQRRMRTEADSVVHGVVSDVATVKMFGGERSEVARLSTLQARLLELSQTCGERIARYEAFLQIWPHLLTVMVFYGASVLTSAEEERRRIATFVLASNSFTETFLNMGWHLGEACATIPSAEKITRVLARRPSKARTGKRDAARAKGHVRFDNVTFSYNDTARPVLRGFSLDVPAGHTVALVGPSGGGKSTIVKLLKGLYRPSNGTISLDGHALDEWEHESLASAMSIVGQEPTLFARSIRDNIQFGLAKSPPLDDIVAAAKRASADSFIARLPSGYDTQVGDRGVRLSGGQKQRIAIARALVRKPAVLILDEATSALDAKSEHFVQQAVQIASATTIIIAHRLSTVRAADRICVVVDGCLVQQGTHDQLLCQGGAYADLVQHQLQ